MQRFHVLVVGWCLLAAQPVFAQESNSFGKAHAAESIDFDSLPRDAWIKLSPLDRTPPSPRLGYEGACVWDSKHQRLIRYGGHNQGGGGEQHSEVWTFDPRTARWEFHEPNVSPPGVCCAQQNVFDPIRGRYIRFSAASGSHGWQWFREIYLNDSSVWTYDLATNTWRDMRPFPTAHPKLLRCASWDAKHQVVVLVGGEGSHEGTWTYDPWTNEWQRKMPKVEPAPRSGGNLAYDARAGVHVLFGSQFDNDPHTWIYDLNSNTWRDAQPAEMPPTDKNDAVLTYDATAGAVVAIVKVSRKDEEGDAAHELQTWKYDVGENRWARLNPSREPDRSGSRARQLLYAPELGVCLLENRPQKPSEQQIWALRLSETTKPSAAATEVASNDASPQTKRPRLVEDLLVSVLSPTKIELEWPANPDAAGYVVERAVVEVLSEDQLRRLKDATIPLESPSVGGFRRIGRFERITREPIAGTSYIDETIDLRQREAVEGPPIEERHWHAEQIDPQGREYRYAVYAYRVRAVDSAGKESGPSPARFTIPDPPQFLFSREEGTSCQLKWQASKEKGVVGYRVYRIDGRYNKDPVSRLTPEPIERTDYTDSTAGKPTRRYYVVAVDALGQEGHPSSPVWYNREWRDYYKPFVGEWHQ